MLIKSYFHIDFSLLINLDSLFYNLRQRYVKNGNRDKMIYCGNATTLLRILRLMFFFNIF